MSGLAPALPSGIVRDDDFELWWTMPGQWVEAPNERRSGWSGVVRASTGERLFYIKRQRNHLCHSLARPFGWPTASREAHFLGIVEALGLRVPKVYFHGIRRTRHGTEAIVATGALEGFRPLSEQTALSPARELALARVLGRALGLLHRARLQHGCLYDKHVMVRWQDEGPEIALLDLEKMRRRLTPTAAARRDLEQLQRHQSVLGQASWAQLLAAHRHKQLDGARPDRQCGTGSPWSRSIGSHIDYGPQDCRRRAKVSAEGPAPLT